MTTQHPSPADGTSEQLMMIDMLMHWDVAGYRGHMPATEQESSSWHPYDAKSAREMFIDLRKGQLSAAHASVAIFHNARAALSIVANWRAQIADSDDLVTTVECADDIQQAHETGRTGILLGFQNSDPFENDLNLVGAFRELGVLIAQLSYNQQNAIAGGTWDEIDAGLTNHLGRAMVSEMNDVGMLIDLSHCSHRTCLDTIDYSESPVAITHANPTDFVAQDDWESYRNSRNKSLDVLKALAEKGGVIGLTTYTRLLPDRDETSIDRFCQMAEWVAEHIGIEHVAFGSDYGYGYNEIDRAWVRQGNRSREPMIEWEPLSRDHPEWAGPRGMTGLADALRQRGWAERDVSAFIGGNWMRLIREVVG